MTGMIRRRFISRGGVGLGRIVRSSKREKLKEMLDGSSRHNRNLLVTFMLLLVYVAVTVTATTDRQLLIPGRGVHLPVLGVEIPLFGFFIAAPLFVLALHFDLLHNLYQHSVKLQRWLGSTEGEGEVSGAIQFPFILNFLLLKDGYSFYKCLLRTIVWAMYNALPLLTLLLIQFKFSKYHSWPMTVWHLAAFLTDTVLLGLFWHRSLRPELIGAEYDSLRRLLGFHYQGGFLNVLRLMFRTLISPLVITYLLIRRKFIARIKEMVTPLRGVCLRDMVVEFLATSARLLESAVFWLLVALAIFNLVILVKLDKIDQYKGFMSKIEAKISVSKGEALSAGWAYYSREKVSGLIANIPAWTVPRLVLKDEVLVESPPSDVILHAYMMKEKSEEDAWLKHAKGLALKGRDLMLADLSGVNLMKADLADADLRGADLSDADLQDAKLSRADLQDAYLEGADLQDAYMIGADLHGANLRRADLHGANLRRAGLQGANFFYADLHGAKLSRADLQDAYLEGAHLHGANLIGAGLQGAYLKGADLHGAYLLGADLQGANLRRADLQGADLEGAHLHGAYLLGADLQGADLRRAGLHGAYMIGADLQGADLEGAHLQGANLIGADLQGAYLSGACLQGADLTDADLQGAVLDNAYIRCTDFRASGLHGILAENPERETGVQWEKLINSLKDKIPEKTEFFLFKNRRESFIARMESAKKVCEKPGAAEVEFDDDYPAFLKARKEVSCIGPYAAKGILGQAKMAQRLKRENEFVEIKQHMGNTCRETLRLTKKKYQKLFKEQTD
jgi:uncharacterized protein YjbI with pentapeptide repeats